MTIDDRLRRHVDDVGIRPVPMARIRHDARVLRRRSTIAVSSAGAVLAVTAVVALGSAGVGLLGPDDEPPEAVADQTVIPAGMEVYGVGRLGILLPDEWSLGTMQCGYIENLTVAVVPRITDSCVQERVIGSPQWATVSFEAAQDVEAIHDLPVRGPGELVTATGCYSDDGSTCWAAGVYGELGVVIEVGRPQSLDAETVAADLAEGIQVLERLGGVPDIDDYGPDAAAIYTATAERAGLEVVLSPRAAASNLAATVSPSPGTVLRDGSTITYTYSP